MWPSGAWGCWEKMLLRLSPAKGNGVVGCAVAVATAAVSSSSIGLCDESLRCSRPCWRRVRRKMNGMARARRAPAMQPMAMPALAPAERPRFLGWRGN